MWFKVSKANKSILLLTLPCNDIDSKGTCAIRDAAAVLFAKKGTNQTAILSGPLLLSKVILNDWRITIIDNQSMRLTIVTSSGLDAQICHSVIWLAACSFQCVDRSTRRQLWKPFLFGKYHYLDKAPQLLLPFDGSTLSICETSSNDSSLTSFSSPLILQMKSVLFLLATLLSTFGRRIIPAMWRYFVTSDVILSTCFLYSLARITPCWPLSSFMDARLEMW